MKKRLLQVLLFFSVVQINIFALENFDISIHLDSGILNGQVKEYVFSPACKNTDNMESKLTWDLDNIPYNEITIDLDLFKNFNISFTTKFAASQRSGVMQDCDWLNSVTTEWKNDDPTELTNYSIHRNVLNDFYSFRISAGYNFRINPIFTVTPFVSWDYDYIHFSAYDGYGIYKVNNFEQINFNGRVICYKNEFNSFMPGIKLSINPFEKFNVTVTGMYNFALGFNNALDYHYTRLTLFNDEINFTQVLKGKLSINFCITKNIVIGASINGQFTPIAKGRDYIILIDGDGEILNPSKKPVAALGGNSNNIWYGGISCSIKF